MLRIRTEKQLKESKRLTQAFQRARIAFNNDLVQIDTFLNTPHDGHTYRQTLMESDEGFQFVIQQMDQQLVKK